MDIIKKLPLALFVLLSSKLLVFKAGWEDVAILLIVASAACYMEYKNGDSRLTKMEQKLRDIEKSLDEAKLSVATVKLHTGMKTNVLR